MNITIRNFNDFKLVYEYMVTINVRYTKDTPAPVLK